jgi:membrane protein required for colicin V production
MTPFDIFVLVIIALSALFALSRGLVTELLSLAAWVGAFIGLRLFFAPVSLWMRSFIDSGPGADILTLGLLFFGIHFLLKFIAGFLGDKVKQSPVGVVDRVLGMAFGALRGLLIVSLAYAALMLLVSREHMPDWVRGSRFEPLVAFGADTVTSFARTMSSDEDEAEQTLPLDGMAPDEEGLMPGYEEDERNQLDEETEKLLREAEQRHGKTEI